MSLKRGIRVPDRYWGSSTRSPSGPARLAWQLFLRRLEQARTNWAMKRVAEEWKKKHV